ncbi:GNAT family N-acetyltransferase [Thermogemmatispora carboxidivorans]|uniref:GNAT family N-acetyltransferase n=1 Tax=Thermogemmatispora carboxidivorans TaxID=1382306 RepID=UPI00069A912F|nr:GNAT family N-acetyltransferase [Thermogemmatispora carboxidivorans]
MPEREFITLIPTFEQLEGNLVIIRPWEESDAPDLFAAVQESREHLRPWLPWADQYQRIEQSYEWIHHQQASWLLRTVLSCAVREKAGGRLLGGLGIHPHDWQLGIFEIGYWLRHDATGHGYMTEAVRLATECAFERWQANRIVIRCDERNERSAAIPRRLGFVFEGCLRNEALAPDGQLRNTLVFALTPADHWQASQYSK